MNHLSDRHARRPAELTDVAGPGRQACYRTPCNHQNQGVRPPAGSHVLVGVLDPVPDSLPVELLARHISYLPMSKEPADQSISACT